MRKLPYILSLLVAASCALFAREAGEKLLIGSTIDFLDYSFFDTIGPEDHYSLESWESRIKQMSEYGLKRIYLRVNACGATNYPTLISERYGTHGRYHWGELMKESLRFSKTLDAYDNLTETIRLGHKYGMEVWACDNLNDDGGCRSDYVEPGYEEEAARLANCPLWEHAYVEHPGWQVQRRPGIAKSPAEAAAINAAAQRLPIARIVIRDTGNVKLEDAGKPFDSFRIKEDEVELYTSADNKRYTRYEGAVKLRGYRDEKGVLCCELSGFEAKGPYFRLAHPVYKDDRWSIAVRDRRDCLVYNTDGEAVPNLWAFLNKPGVSNESTPFNFSTYSSCGWDYKHHQLGFHIGCLDVSDKAQYIRGVTEFAVPDAMAFRLRKFAEIANYSFDGFMINLRTHSLNDGVLGGNPKEYGFNPEVREKTIERCGKDPAVDDSAIPVMHHIRAEAIADYFKGFKTLIGNRPLYISGLSNKKYSHYKNLYGDLPWLYERYFADGSVDGVMMMGNDFRDELTPEVLQGRKIKLGFFREMCYHPAGYSLEKDLDTLQSDLQIDEVELYETMILSKELNLFEHVRKHK